MDCYSAIENEVMDDNDGVRNNGDPEVLPLSDLWKVGMLDPTVDEMEKINVIDVNMLNDEQRHAYDIVDWHLQETINGKLPPQLLMIIPGEGGVGKSKVIQTMSQNFEN
jgi:predicted ATP-dependent serine protease